MVKLKHKLTHTESWGSLELQETHIESQNRYRCTVDSDSVFTVQPNLLEIEFLLYTLYASGVRAGKPRPYGFLLVWV